MQSPTTHFRCRMFDAPMSLSVRQESGCSCSEHPGMYFSSAGGTGRGKGRDPREEGAPEAETSISEAEGVYITSSCLMA